MDPTPKTLKSLLRSIVPGEETFFDFVPGAGPTSDDPTAPAIAPQLKVSLRRLPTDPPRDPVRAPSPARAHEFVTAESLRDYLLQFGTREGKTVVFCDVSNECVAAVLQDDAARGVEIVRMKPEPHPLWIPWASALARGTIALDDLWDLVQRHRRSIVEPDGRALLLDISQVKGSVSVEIQRGRGRSSLNGLIVTSKVEGSSKPQSEHVDMPETITLEVPLYVSSPPVPQKIELDVSFKATSSGEVTVTLTAGTVAEARVLAFEGMVAVLRDGLAPIAATFTFGRPKHALWSTLPEPARS